MTYLLDTCTFIWLCAEPDRLSVAAKAAVDSSNAGLALSHASILEITLKWEDGKLQLPSPPRTWIEEQLHAWQLAAWALSAEDIYRSAELPQHHRDPFDRLLVAVALNHAATILTPDPAMHQYPVAVRW